MSSNQTILVAIERNQGPDVLCVEYMYKRELVPPQGQPQAFPSQWHYTNTSIMHTLCSNGRQTDRAQFFSQVMEGWLDWGRKVGRSSSRGTQGAHTHTDMWSQKQEQWRSSKLREIKRVLFCLCRKSNN